MISSVGGQPVSGSRRTSASSTQQPSAASRCAIARPIPDDEPVTITERGILVTFPGLVPGVLGGGLAMLTAWALHLWRIAC